MTNPPAAQMTPTGAVITMKKPDAPLQPQGSPDNEAEDVPVQVSVQPGADVPEQAPAPSAVEFDADTYAVGLAELLRRTDLPLTKHRERLAELAALDMRGDDATSAELARHVLLLSALFERFTREAEQALRRPHAGDTAVKFLDAAMRAQRAAMTTLGAMKTLRGPPYRLP